MKFKLVTVFTLHTGKADEEIERCKSPDSLSNILKTFPGFISYELVKVNEESTMAIQTWETKKHFAEAMPKAIGIQSAKIKGRDNLVISHQSYSGEVVLENKSLTV